jgi:hypothetical protein
VPSGSDAGGGNPPAQQPPALTAESISALIAAALKPIAEQVAALKPADPPPPPPPPPAGSKGQNADLEGLPPALAAEIVESRKQLATLRGSLDQMKTEAQREREQADQARRQAEVSSHLAGFTFVSDRARETFQREVLAQVVKAEDGTLTVGGLPLKNAIAGMLDGEYAYNLKPLAGGGTGAHPGSGKTKGPGLDTIKPGMSKEDEHAVGRQILAALNR